MPFADALIWIFLLCIIAGQVIIDRHDLFDVDRSFTWQTGWKNTSEENWAACLWLCLFLFGGCGALIASGFFRGH